MATINLETENIASTGRPDEYKGTIAIDHHTAGTTIENIINPLISSYIKEGYSFYGLKIYMGAILDFTGINDFPVYVILGRRLDEDTWEYKKVSKRVSIPELLLACTAIDIQFSSRTDFEQNNINWNNVEEIEEDDAD